MVIQFQLLTLFNLLVGDQIILTYEKNGRYASIELTQRGIGFWSGLSSLITVSIVHPESIGDQNPYLALKQRRFTESYSQKRII